MCSRKYTRRGYGSSGAPRNAGCPHGGLCPSLLLSFPFWEMSLRDFYSVAPFSATISPSSYGFMEEAIWFHPNERYEKVSLRKLALANGVRRSSEWRLVIFCIFFWVHPPMVLNFPGILDTAQPFYVLWPVTTRL